MAATQDADMAEDDSSELAPSTSIPTATSATTMGATPTTSLGNDEGEEEEEPKPKPRKKRNASSAKKKKEAESNGASGESADGGEATVHIYENFMHGKAKRVYGGIAVILFLLFLLCSDVLLIVCTCASMTLYFVLRVFSTTVQIWCSDKVCIALFGSNCTALAMFCLVIFGCRCGGRDSCS